MIKLQKHYKEFIEIMMSGKMIYANGKWESKNYKSLI